MTGARAVTVGGNDDWGVKANQSITVAGSRTETIDGLMNVANTVSGPSTPTTRKVGAALMINSAIAVAESVGGNNGAGGGRAPGGGPQGLRGDGGDVQTARHRARP